MDLSTLNSQLTLALTAEQSALASSVSHVISALVSIKSPEASPTERQPLELVAVVDRSGSMSGQKMAAMIEALSFLVNHGLQKDDRFALVAFDNNVDLRLPVAKMDAVGKKKALQEVTALKTGGSTNLSGGLLKAIDILTQATGSTANANRAILLFTDGIANNGITDPAGIVAAAQGAMVGTPMTVFTFGFGSDHTESLLRTLAEDTNGLYYYVAKSEDIPVSFADCLGGLVSVVAQNAVLRLEGLNGNTVTNIHCHYKRETTGESSGITLQLGDLYAEDEKDILLSVLLPVTDPQPASAPAISVVLRYFCVGASKVVETVSILQLARPAETPAGQLPPQRLLEQQERVALSDAMSQASELADRGQIEHGRKLLQEACKRAESSPVVNSPTVQNILKDAVQAESGFRDEGSYRSYGSKTSKMAAMSHQMQRSTHSSGKAYERKSKVAMKSAFASYSPALPPTPASPPEKPPLGAVPMTKARKKSVSMFPSVSALFGSSSKSVDID